jgi:nickel superoxide dismutase
MNRKLLVVLAGLALLASMNSLALAHCQIPCGIYDDPVRFSLLREHITTIEKSMKEIQAISQSDKPDWNQLVRWVGNKESHADQFTEIVTFYFLTQRVKPADPTETAATAKYVTQLKLLHAMMLHAMKAKQTTDLEHCEQLRALVDEFEAVYLGKQATAAAHTHGPATVPHAH